VGLLSSDGRFKRLPIEKFQDLSGRATSVLKLKEGVSLQRAVLCRTSQDLVLASSTGRLLRLAVYDNNLPVMGRNAQGPVLLRLVPSEVVVSAASVSQKRGVSVVTRQRMIKRLLMDRLRLYQHENLGQITVRFSHRNDQLIDLCSDKADQVAAILSSGCSLRLDPYHLMALD